MINSSSEDRNNESTMIKVESDDMEPNNSLLPPEVLEHLLEFLPFHSLRSSRLVNPNWAKAAVVPMRKKSAPVSFRFQVRTGGIYEPSSYSHKDLERFVACLQASGGNFPVSKFEIALSPLDRETNLDPFFMAVSPVVTELGLTFNLGRNRPKTWPGNYAYPKLASLKLKLDNFPGIQKKFPIFAQETFGFIEEIIGQAPKLKMVSLEFGNHNRPGLPGAGEVCFEAISERGVLLEKLTHLQLKVTDFKKESDFSKLSSIHDVKLNTVRINGTIGGGGNWVCSRSRRTAVIKFLESQADSLVTLEIGQELAGEKTVDILELPALRKLEQLNIPQHIVIKGLSSMDFPALKSINISARYWYGLFLHIYEYEDQFNSVEELTVGELLNLKGYEILREAAKFFPNISRLAFSPTSTSYEKGMLGDLFDSFPNLVQLSLTNNSRFEFMENIITGLDEQELQALETEMNRKPHQKEEFCRRKLRAANLKSIARLQKLETLRIRNGEWDLPIEFGYASSFVLKSMDSLKYLDLGIRCFPESNERTQAVLLDLKEKLCVTYDDPPETRKERVKVEVQPQPLNS